MRPLCGARAAVPALLAALAPQRGAARFLRLSAGAGNGGVVSPHQEYRGRNVLCHRGSLWVVVDGDINSRMMTFGASADVPLTQTMVRCRGRAPDSCMEKGDAACDLSPSRCPCEFHMPRLPPLDLEYQFIAHRLGDSESDTEDDDAPPLSPGSAGAAAGGGANATGGDRILMIGLGGGMLPQYLLERHPDLAVDAVEVSADVVAAARAFFGVGAAEAAGRLSIQTDDGLAALRARRGAGYRAVVVDCFVAGRVAEACRTPSFAEALRGAVRGGGEVMQNVIISNPEDREQDALIKNDLGSLLDAYRGAFGGDSVSLKTQSDHSENAVVVARVDAGN